MKSKKQTNSVIPAKNMGTKQHTSGVIPASLPPRRRGAGIPFKQFLPQLLMLFLLLIGVTQIVSAQNQPAQPTRPTRQRPSQAAAAEHSVPVLSERAQIKNQEESSMPLHIVWERIVYRNVDLTKDNNAALYYPVQPVDDRQNLFTLLFKLLQDDKIPAYTYVDGQEVFSDKQRINFEEILKKYQIAYTKNGTRFVVDEGDIPGSEATQYMIKEGYYFDQATGSFKTEVLALCPMLVRPDYYYGGAPTREPLFWVRYDDIRPYISRELIMTSNYNNVLTYTMDDYFRKNMYTGDIVKTMNLMGKTLAQEVGSTNPDSLRLAQDSIERQLKFFDEKLWVYNDSTAIKAENTKLNKSTKSSAKTVKTVKTEKSEKSEKTATPKATNSSTPTKSVRRTR
ncbi:MAG: gliding motility protein GldN [Candidatus Symbiothrix sp.]|jgi:gliding motility associated protien GldN|nr:gliding motility protein GldN [Candidatus Symbiothrix sp.]